MLMIRYAPSRGRFRRLYEVVQTAQSGVVITPHTKTVRVQILRLPQITDDKWSVLAARQRLESA